MAETPSVREFLRRSGREGLYVHLEELKSFFLRELMFGSAEDLLVMPGRSGKGEAEGAAGDDVIAFDRADFPLLGPIRRLDLVAGRLEFERIFSTDADRWLEAHRPLAAGGPPVVSAVMALESFMEAKLQK